MHPENIKRPTSQAPGAETEENKHFLHQTVSEV